MRKGAIAAVIAALGLMALVIAGCGGDDSETSGAADSGEPLTRAQFVKEANSICINNDRERQERFAELAGEAKSTPGREKLVLEGFAEPYRQMIEDLEELGLPKGEEQEVEAILRAMEKGAQELEDDPLKGLGSIAMFNEANELSSKYGIENCVV